MATSLSRVTFVDKQAHYYTNACKRFGDGSDWPSRFLVTIKQVDQTEFVSNNLGIVSLELILLWRKYKKAVAKIRTSKN